MGKNALILVLLAPCAAAAQEHYPIRIFESVDVFWARNVNDALARDGSAAAKALVNTGFDYAHFDVGRQAALGGRVGLLTPLAKREGFRLDGGASAGYVSGPDSTALLSAYGGVAGDGRRVVERSLRTVRFLAEFVASFRLSESWSVRLGGAAGAAYVRERDACTAIGSLQGTCPYDFKSQSWTGLTWEASPSIAWRINVTDLTLGFRYAGWPQFGGTGQTSRIVWTPTGAFIGAVFHFD